MKSFLLDDGSLVDLDNISKVKENKDEEQLEELLLEENIDEVDFGLHSEIDSADDDITGLKLQESDSVEVEEQNNETGKVMLDGFVDSANEHASKATRESSPVLLEDGGGEQLSVDKKDEIENVFSEVGEELKIDNQHKQNDKALVITEELELLEDNEIDITDELDEQSKVSVDDDEIKKEVDLSALGFGKNKKDDSLSTINTDSVDKKIDLDDKEFAKGAIVVKDAETKKEDVAQTDQLNTGKREEVNGEMSNDKSTENKKEPQTSETNTNIDGGVRQAKNDKDGFTLIEGITSKKST